MTRKTAVIYARVSTARQAADQLPIDGQIENCHARAKVLGAEVLRVFTDPGISGREEFRPGFQEAVAFCKEHKVEFFITWSTSRFARDHIVAALYKRLLSKGGTQMVYCTMDVDTETPAGFVLDGVMAIFDEHYSRAISADTTRSMLKNARDGFWNGGNAPFGYKSVPSERNPRRRDLVVVPAEAWIVQQIFQWRISGAGIRPITKRLNDSGFLKRGKEWCCSTVHFLLRNPVVNGYITFGKNKKSLTGGDHPGTVSVRAYTPIIADEMWEKVQAIMKNESPKNAGSPHSTHLFTGLLKCGECGNSMQVETAKGRSQRYSYYNCSDWQKNRQCTSKRRPTKLVDDWLLDTVLNKAFSPEILFQVAADLNADCGRWAQERRTKVKALEAQMADASRRKARLFEILELHGKEAPNLGDLSERLRELSDQIKKLGSTLNEIEAQETPTFGVGDADVQAIRAVLEGIVRDKTDIRRSRMLLQQVLESVVLHSDRAEILYKSSMLTNDPAQTISMVHTTRKWLPVLNVLGTKSRVFWLPDNLRRAA